MNEAYMWELVKRCVYFHIDETVRAKLNIGSSDDLTGDMRMDRLYPRSNGESANRLGIAVLDCLKHINKPPSYVKRSEYFVFPTLEALWDYLVEYVEMG